MPTVVNILTVKYTATARFVSITFLVSRHTKGSLQIVRGSQAPRFLDKKNRFRNPVTSATKELNFGAIWLGLSGEKFKILGTNNFSP